MTNHLKFSALCLSITLFYGCNDHDTFLQKDIKNPVVLIPNNHQSALNVALFQAVQQENVNVVKRLLDQGGNPNYQRSYGNDWQHIRNGRLLKSETDVMTVLMSASAWGDRKTVELLLERGANINAVDTEGFTALHWAAMGEHVGNVKSLIAHGANTTATANNGELPKDMAAGNPEIIILFQEHNP